MSVALCLGVGAPTLAWVIAQHIGLGSRKLANFVQKSPFEIKPLQVLFGMTVTAIVEQPEKASQLVSTLW